MLEFELSGVPGFSDELMEPFPQRREELRAALTAGKGDNLGLYGHGSRTEFLALTCQASASISRRRGDGFLGVPARPGLTLTDHLLATHALTRLVAPCLYGIAYLRSAHLAPAFYARGRHGRSLLASDEEDEETQTQISRFDRENCEARRHLRGMFRSVYPAQLLTQAHRGAQLADGSTVAELGLGAWAEVEGGLWLWELSEQELPVAVRTLDRAGFILAA